jgi:hypothetical protein
MNTEQVNDTSRLDAWLNIQRERERAWNQAHVYQARAESNRQLWKPLLAGAAGAAMVVAAVWVAMPKFMVRDIEVPHIVQHDMTIEVPHIVQHDVVIETPKLPMPKPSKAVPTAQEREFTSQSDYKTAEYHGRVVGPSNNGGFLFDSGLKMDPIKTDDGISAVDIDRFIGDYAFCKKRVADAYYTCKAIHNNVVQDIPRKAVHANSISERE